MYQALYRKYRPKTFDDVVGQETIIKTLKNEINNNKINHAYLFCGPRGTGKTSVAKIFAKVVNCENLINCNPCNKCVSCTQINDGENTDIVEIDAASNNGVDEIRELKSKVNLVPSVSKYKVYIIDEVHMLSIGAFNALLKTLEEPPHHAIFILATTDPYKLPTTILSRCQRFDFKKVSQKSIVDRLSKIAKIEKIKASDEVLNEVARLSDGGLRDAISMLDQLVSYCDDEITIEAVHEINGTVTQKDLANLIFNILSGNLKDVFSFLDKCDNEGKNIVKLTNEIMLFLKNSLLVNLKINADYEKIYSVVCDTIDNENIIRLIRKINDNINVMRFSSDPKLIFELAIIDYANGLKELKEKIVTNIEELNQTESKVAITASEEIKTAKNAVKNEEVIKTEQQSEEKKYFPGNNNISYSEKLWEIRVGNSMSGYSHSKMLEVKAQCPKLKDLIFDKKIGKYATLLTDGELKSAGNDYLLFLYKNKNSAEVFNNNLGIIEKLISKAFNHSYRAIAVDSDEWENIKKEFKENKQNFKYAEETEELLNKSKESKTNKDDVESMFGSIIEYK
jgi:DNA polymerase-3 subunit gamma/tau